MLLYRKENKLVRVVRRGGGKREVQSTASNSIQYLVNSTACDLVSALGTVKEMKV